MEAVDLKKIRKSLFGLPTTKVSRSLFGEVNHEEVKKDLEREYKELLEEKTKLWNFDFERYQPRTDTESKLKWIPYSSPVTEHSIRSQTSLITSSTSCQTIDYTSRFQKPADATLPKKTSKSPCINTKSPINKTIKDTLKQSPKQPNTIFSTNTDEESIKIVNESPIRNITSSKISEVPIEESKVKLDITKSLSRKRKRGSQPTIDGTYYTIIVISI